MSREPYTTKSVTLQATL